MPAEIFWSPIPEVADFAALNAHLLVECLKDDLRRVDRQPVCIQQSWALEQSYLRPRPEHDFACCATVPVTLTPYGQVVFETNRYSVPVEDAYRHLVLKAYPFRVDVVHQERVIASHPRCHALHGSKTFTIRCTTCRCWSNAPAPSKDAKPLRQWRERWPAVYEQLLAHLRAQPSENQGLREFVQILGLHREYLPTLVEQAISQSLTYGCAHLNGVRLCLRQLQYPEQPLGALDLTQRPHLAGLGQQPLDLHHYEHLLAEATLGETS